MSESIKWINWDEEEIQSSDDESDDYVCSDQEDDFIPERELKKAKNIELRHPITPLPEKKMKKILDEDGNDNDDDDDEVEYNLYRKEKIFTPAKDGKIYIDAPYTPAPLKEKQLSVLSQLPWFKRNPNHRPIMSNKLNVIDIDEMDENDIIDIEYPNNNNNNIYSPIHSSYHENYIDDDYNNISQTYDIPSYDDQINSPVINDSFSSPFVINDDESLTSVINSNSNRKKITPKSIEYTAERKGRMKKKVKKFSVKMLNFESPKSKHPESSLKQQQQQHNHHMTLYNDENLFNNIISKRSTNKSNGFNQFINDKLPSLKKENPGKSNAHLIHLLSQQWSLMTPSKRSVYS